jgi:hypothetical protein
MFKVRQPFLRQLDRLVEELGACEIGYWRNLSDDPNLLQHHSDSLDGILQR